MYEPTVHTLSGWRRFFLFHLNLSRRIYCTEKSIYLTFRNIILTKLDVQYLRMFTIANDSYSPEFKSHLPCIINGFKTLASQSRSCWADFAEKASKIIPSVTAVQDVDKIAEDMCR